MLSYMSEYLIRNFEGANIVMLTIKRRIWWPGTSDLKGAYFARGIKMAT